MDQFAELTLTAIAAVSDSHASTSSSSVGAASLAGTQALWWSMAADTPLP